MMSLESYSSSRSPSKTPERQDDALGTSTLTAVTTCATKYSAQTIDKACPKDQTRGLKRSRSREVSASHKRSQNCHDKTLEYPISKQTADQRRLSRPQSVSSVVEEPKTHICRRQSDSHIESASSVIPCTQFDFHPVSIINPATPKRSTASYDNTAPTVVDTLLQREEVVQASSKDISSDYDDDWMLQFIDLSPKPGHSLSSEVVDTVRPGDTLGSHHEPTSTFVFTPPNLVAVEDHDGLPSSKMPADGTRDFLVSEPPEEQYMVDSSDEEAMVSLLTETPNNRCRVPPTSVVQAMDIESRDDAVFDRTLQRSPPDPSSSGQCPQGRGQEMDLLDEEIDWNSVLATTDSIRRGTSSIVEPAKDDFSFTSPPREMCKPSIAAAPAGISVAGPFIRPPFPEKVHDRSNILGVSSSVLLRTCFRIGELLKASSRCRQANQQVIYELYARATYSNRSSQTRTQHFQFKDLFTDRQPYPNGKLQNWKVGSLLDRQAQDLVGQTNKLCRCVCVMERDETLDLGWRVKVLSIRATDWDEIRWVRRIMARDDPVSEDAEEVDEA